jgi:putative DNA primase/helicase
MTLDPRAVARALGGIVSGGNVVAPGPGHSRADRSLSIKIDPAAPDGFVVHSFAGDPPITCRDYVRAALGLGERERWRWQSSSLRSPPSIAAPTLAETSRTTRALNIWRDTQRGAGSIVARYLASREIACDQWPPSMRFHPRCPRPKDDVGNFVSPLPAMVALVEHVERGPVAVHCTYLRRDGSGKADIEKPKAIFGPVGGGAVRLGAPREGQWLAVGEGLETTLSVAVACAIPAWAALSAGGIKNLLLPPEATHVVICADHDASGTGERAAHEAAACWLAEGRRVRVAKPPDCGTDFNDVLAGRAAVKINEAHYVA